MKILPYTWSTRKIYRGAEISTLVPQWSLGGPITCQSIGGYVLRYIEANMGYKMPLLLTQKNSTIHSPVWLHFLAPISFLGDVWRNKVTCVTKSNVNHKSCAWYQCDPNTILYICRHVPDQTRVKNNCP